MSECSICTRQTYMEEESMLNSEFLLTSLIVILIPGTGVIFTVSNGLFFGKRASVAAALGCTAGIIPHLLACSLGLSMLLHASAITFQAVKFIGAVYLLYLAWGMWNETGSVKFESCTSSSGYLKILVKGFLINILNPKLSIFFLAFIPLFVSEDVSSPTLHMLLLSTMFMGMTFVVFVMYGLLASRISKYMVDSSVNITRIQKSLAAIFAILGVKLALAEQP